MKMILRVPINPGAIPGRFEARQELLFALLNQSFKSDRVLMMEDSSWCQKRHKMMIHLMFQDF
jgi:hypothetical protein